MQLGSVLDGLIMGSNQPTGSELMTKYLTRNVFVGMRLVVTSNCLLTKKVSKNEQIMLLHFCFSGTLFSLWVAVVKDQTWHCFLAI